MTPNINVYKIQMREYRQNNINHFYVHNWKTFKEVWKPTDFTKDFKDQTLDQVRSTLLAYFQELIQDEKSLCALFPDSVKKEHLDIITSLVKEQFSQVLDYDYEALYFGKKKQMLVYRFNHRSLVAYLSKYRLPSKYSQLFEATTRGYQEYQKKLLEKNLLISNRNPRESILKCQQQMQEIMKFKFGKTLTIYTKYLESILKDFVSQPKRQEILLQKINSEVRKSIQALCEKMDLKISDRYYDDQPHLNVKDLLIHKNDYEQNEEGDFEMDSSLKSDEDADEVDENSQKEQQIVRPKNISGVKVSEIKKEGVLCLVQLKASGTMNRPNYLKCTVRYPKNVEYEKKVDISQEEIKETVVVIMLDPVSNGYCEYCLTTGNEAGESSDMIVKIWAQIEVDSQTHQKYIRQQNDVLYILGESEDGLIIDSQQTDLGSTEGKWKKQIVCTDFSVSNHAIICNKDGDCAGWGKMYCFGEDPDQKQETPQQEIQDEFNYVRPYFFRIQKLSLLLDGAFIRKVSCGNSYCLMADSLGQAYSFGLNSFGQLGQGHANQAYDTSQPQIINKLCETFIVDVVATDFGSSFAVDYSGKGYRWGLNQIQSSPKPITDTFSNIINFQYSEMILSQHTPLKITNKMIDDPIKQICGGKDFSLILTTKNVLYGWGNTDYLGIQKIENSNFQKIQNICNPIQLMKNIQRISVGCSHCLALSDSGKLIGWGQSTYFTHNPKGIIKSPQVLTDKFNAQFFQCGTQFSIIETEPGYIRFYGKNKLASEELGIKLPEKVIKLKTGRGVVMALCKKQ